MDTNDCAADPQEGLADAAKEIVQKAHAVAKEEAVKLLPEDDVNYIIGKVLDVLQKKQSPADAMKEIAVAHAAAAQAYTKVFAHEALQETLKKSDISAVRELTDTDFSERMVGCCATIAISVKGFMTHEITEAQFISQIGGTDIASLGIDFLGAAGPEGAQALCNPELLAGLCAPVVGFAASTAAYKLLMQALEDAALAREERVRIEQQCQQSIVMIRQYRAEMEEVVSEYLTKHIETFEAGFAAMDRSILAGDVDGYIRGNAEIQAVLGYKAQFSNQQEFHDLMNSDTAFQL